MNPTPPANAESTEAVAKPVPDEGETHFPRTLAMFSRLLKFRGSDLASEFFADVSKLETECRELQEQVESLATEAMNLRNATAQPTPSGPTDVHSQEVRERIAELEAAYEQMEHQLGSMTANRDVIWGQLQEARSALTVAETKAGAMERELDALRKAIIALPCVPTDDPTNPYKCQHSTHLIARAWKNDFCPLHRVLQTLPPTPSVTPKCSRCNDTGWVRGVGGLVECLHPALPSVASEKEGKISNDSSSTEGSAEHVANRCGVTMPELGSSENQASPAVTLLPFDLAKALAGAKVVTRDGREATKIVNTDDDGDPVLLVTVDGAEDGHCLDGTYLFDGYPHRRDLFLAPTP